jgi:hypothetical protein
VEASVWNDRLLAALENGVRGGKRFSLIDKVYRAETLKEKRPGRGVCREDHQRWPNQFIAAQGLFTMNADWKPASQFR